jgi:Tol biopolymer transport system component
VLAGGPASRAAAQGFGRNKIQYRDHDFERLATPHFDILFHQGGRDLAAQAALWAEAAHADLITRLQHQPAERIPLVVYNSPNDFQQTNVLDRLIGEGTGGFSEAARRRIVLPYGGSNAEFRHVVRHEVAHAFTFDLVYGRRLDSVLARRSLRPLPLWFAEGLAEFLSREPADAPDLVLRDAVLSNELVPLDAAAGYGAYEQGRSVFAFVAESFGAEKVAEVVRAVRHTHDVHAAFEKVLGIGTEELERRWRRALRRRYWPAYAGRQEVDDVGRRLTDHRGGGSQFDLKPRLSPAGDRLLLVSDRDGPSDLLLVSAVDGRVLRRLVRGATSGEFESLHGFDSSLDWSPDGRSVCFVAKSRGRETLFLVDADSGREQRRVRLDLDAAASPAWSPDGGRIVLRGTRHGRTDLWLVDLADGTLRQLTADGADEADPGWLPDGRRIAFVRYPDLLPPARWDERDGGTRLLQPAGAGDLLARRGSYDLHVLEVDTGAVRLLVETPADERGPCPTPDGRQILLTATVGGVSNLYRFDLESGLLRRCSDVAGGLFDPHLSASGRLALTAYEHGGWDVVLVDDAAAVLRGERDVPELVAAGRGGAGLPGAPAGARPEAPDPLPTADGAAAGGEPAVLGTLRPYEHGFGADFIGGNVGYSTFYGPAGLAQLSASDLLGNHRILAALDVYRSLRDSNALLGYYYLPKRIDYGVGVFHFRDHFASQRGTFGEYFGDERLFAERNWGAFGSMSLPFTTFTRLDLELDVTGSQREFYAYDAASGDFLLVSTEDRFLTQPTLGLVHDSARWDAGQRAIAGSRWMLWVAPALPLGERAVHRASALVDWRRYTTLGRRSALACRVLGGWSSGRDELTFFLGGPSSLRGYDVLAFQGTRMGLVALEYRFPLVDWMAFGWPERWGLANVGGLVFFEAGTAWRSERDATLRLAEGAGGWHLRDARADFGVGLRLPVSVFQLKLDVAWPTDLRTTEPARTHFSIGLDY